MEGIDPKLLAKLKEEVQKKLVQRERECVEFWFSELQKIYQKQHRTLEDLRADLRILLDKMKNRLEVIKTKGY
jgi:hypothetical protein